MKIKSLIKGISPFIFKHLFCRALPAMSLFAFAPLVPTVAPGRIQYAGPDEVIRRMEPGATIERQIAEGETHSYLITLAPGQFLRVTVNQKDVDVFVRLFDEKGGQLVESRNYLDKRRPERLSFAANEYGDHRLEVIAPAEKESVGSYELKVEPLRVATPEDLSLIAAEKLTAEAEALQAQGKAEPLKEAISKYEQSLPLWRQAGDGLGEAGALQYMALARRTVGESEKAIEHLALALSIYRAAGERRGESQTLRGLGLFHHLSGDLHSALEYYEQTLPLSKELKDREGEAGTLNNIGGVYYYMGEYQKGLEYYGSSLVLQQSLGNTKGEATTLNNIGEIYRTLGEYRRTLEYLDKALLLRRSIKDLRGEGVTLNNIGLTYATLGDYEKSLDHHERSLALRRTVGDRYGEAASLNNIGFVYQKLGQYDRAMEFFNRVLELRRAVADRRGEANTLHQLGSVYASMGETEKAMKHFNKSLPLSRAAWDRALEAATLHGMARIERDRGNLAEARAHMETTLDIIESLRSRVAGQELRETFFASRQDHYEMQIDVLMRLHQLRPSEGHDGRAFEANERARARTLLDILTEARADIREGVDLSLLERERLLQQQLNSKERLRMQMAGRNNAQQQIEVVEKEIGNLLNQYREVRSQIRVSSPSYAALIDPQPLTLKEIQQQVLDEDSLLLQYSLGEKRSYLWAVTPSAIASYALPPRAEIEAAARRVYELLTARNDRSSAESAREREARLTQSDADCREAARRLSRMILGPVSQLMETKRLIVAAEGALQYIPFGALTKSIVSGQKAGIRNQQSINAHENRLPSTVYRPLIADHEIINLPSASTLAVLRRESNGRRPAPKLLAVLADPVFGGNDPRITLNRRRKASDSIARNQVSADQKIAALEIHRPADESGTSRFRRLRFSRLEANAIAALVPAENRLKAIDFAANRTTATSTALGQYRILHFATHGLLDSQQPELSCIVLSLVDERGRAQDGFLSLHEIYNLRIGADLVVLSACRTALGKEIRGEGLVGLVRGFMYAGAARVTASLWNVQDRATAELMKRFYRGMLGEGMTPAAALRAAQVSMWKEKRWQQPYYWAGFTMQGEWK